jgi:hypothetical protein
MLIAYEIRRYLGCVSYYKKAESRRPYHAKKSRYAVFTLQRHF